MIQAKGVVVCRGPFSSQHPDCGVSGLSAYSLTNVS